MTPACGRFAVIPKTASIGSHDGTIVATPQATYRENDGGGCIVGVRFKIFEIDAMAAQIRG